MLQRKIAAFTPILVMSAFTSIVGLGLARAADDAPPPPSAPGSDAPAGRRHHNPAWAACKKQADDQKLERGDARRDFMKSCLGNAKDSAPPAS